MSLLNRGRSDVPGHRPPEGPRLNDRMPFLSRLPEDANLRSPNKGRESVSPVLLNNTAEIPDPGNSSESPAARLRATGSDAPAKGDPGAQRKGGEADQSGEQKPGKPGETEAEIAEAVTLKEAVEAAASQSDDSSSDQFSQENTNQGDLNNAWPPAGEWQKQWEQPVGGDKTISHLSNLSSAPDGIVVDEHAMALRGGDGKVLAIETDTRSFDKMGKPGESYQRQVHTRFADGSRIEQEFSNTTSSDGRFRVLEYTRRESDPNGASTATSQNLTIREDGAWKYTETGPDGTRTISHHFDSSKLQWTTTEARESQTPVEIIEGSSAPLDPLQTPGDLRVESPGENMIKAPLESLANAESPAIATPIQDADQSPEKPSPTAISEEAGASATPIQDTDPPPEASPEKPSPTAPGEQAGAAATPDGKANLLPEAPSEKPSPATTGEEADPPPEGPPEDTFPTAPGEEAGASATPIEKADPLSEPAAEKPSTTAPGEQADLAPEAAPENPSPATPGQEGKSSGDAGRGNKSEISPEAKEAIPGLARDYDAALDIPSSPEEAEKQGFKPDPRGPRTDPKNGIETATLTRKTLNGDGSITYETIEFKKGPDGEQQAELTRGTQLKGATISERVSRNIVTDKSGSKVQVTKLERTIKPKSGPATRETIVHRKRTDGQSIEHIRMTPQPDGTVWAERAATNYSSAGQAVNSSYRVETTTINARVNIHEDGSTTYRYSTGKSATGSDSPPGTTAILVYDAKGQLTSSKVLDADGKPVADPKNHPLVQRHIASDRKIEQEAPQGKREMEQKLPEQQRPAQRGPDQRAPGSHNSNGGSSNIIRVPTDYGMVEVPMGGFYVGGNFKGGWGNCINSPQINIGQGRGRERGKGDLFRQAAMGLFAFNIAWGHTVNTAAQGSERVASSGTRP